MNEPDLPTLRRAAVLGDGDARSVYRWRVAAVRAGHDLWAHPGDELVVQDGVGRALSLEETAAGPPLVRVLTGARERALSAATWRVVGPHRPAVLLGEDELRRRAQEDAAHPHDPRAVETLHELARRAPRHAVDLALDLLPALEQAAADDPLRGALAALLRSRPPGEVEVALLRRPREGQEVVEVCALAAAAPDEAAARDVLARLADLPAALQARAVAAAGRWLVGAGGAGFLSASVREEVGAQAREHPDRDVRRALFTGAAAPLQREELVVAALDSAAPAVRAAAAADLLRRGTTAPVWARARVEDDAGVLEACLRAEPAPPHDVLARALARGAGPGPDEAALEARALRRVPELEDAAGALDLLLPWLSGERARALDEALAAAGLLPPAAAGEVATQVLERARADEALQGVALEALARLGGGAAEQALDAWGADLLRTGGPWGEEAALTAGLLLGRGVDALELLGRFVLDPPRGPSRRARLLDVAGALLRGPAGPERALAQRLVRASTVRLARFRPVLESAAAIAR